MQGWRAWWDGLTQESRDFIVAVGATLAAALIGSIVYAFRNYIAALGRRLFAAEPQSQIQTSTPPPLPPVVVEIRTPTAPPQEPKPTEPTPPAPLPQIPRAPKTGFVARRDTEGNLILERLIEELAPEKQQLLALCGAGGVGKTTLAAAAVRALTDAFARRVAWVSADGRPDFALSTLLDGIAVQLGHEDLRPLPLEQKDERLCALLAESPALVVLDNFETVADTEKESCADWLANHAPCCAVITARDAVPHARPVNIHAMSPPEAREFVKLLIGQARHPESFEGLNHEQIVEEAERNPLLLQWIVKQIDLARQPDTVLNELARGRGDAAERVFGRSFRLLSDDARAALLALSLFVPDASREALVEVAGFDTDAARLDAAAAQLAELWLVNTTQGNTRLSVAGLTREMSKHRLHADARAADFRQRFVACFVRHAKTHRQETPEDLNALEMERENILAATDVAFEGQRWPELEEMYDAIFAFLDVRGYWDEAIRHGELAVQAARETDHKGVLAAFAGHVAKIRQNRGEYNQAKEALSQVITAFKELGHEENVAIGLHRLGTVAQYQGERKEARRLYSESMEIKRRIGNQHGIRATLHNLAILAREEGNIAEARRLLHESLEIGQQVGDQRSVALTSIELGRISQTEGDTGEARRLYEEGLAINRQLRDQNGIAISLSHLGMMSAEQGDKTEARRLFREALTIFEKLGSPNAAVMRQNLERLEGGES